MRKLLTVLHWWPLVVIVSAPFASAAGDELFRAQVAPVLERRCLGCHNDAERKGGLSLATRDQFWRGGDSGAVFDVQQPERSPLLQAVLGDPPEMPKTGSRLTAEEVAALRAWLKSGAAWPEGQTLTERPQADLNWWSLKPLHRPMVPQATGAAAGWVRNPIDQFIAARLAAEGMTPSPEADRRTLIRRLSFDLLGLPPTPADVAAFVHDPAPDAYERLVDRLLASPHFGERWARHWLDVVHYGDTHGYDKDKPRPNAWPYRDYVIRAFNDDKPYTQFIAEQLAGDVVSPGTQDGITALGFIAAGPWDFISHVEVPESKIDGQIARSLDRDDMVVNALNTFCSTTVQCARCHAHKFDPISQIDYYRLQAVFAALDRSDRPFDADPVIGRRRQALLDSERQLLAEQRAAQAEVQRQGGDALAAIDRRLSDAKKSAGKGLQVPPEYGYHSRIETDPDRVKWVQVDLGDPALIAKVVLMPCHDTFNNIGAGFGFPPRWKVELCDDPQFAENVTVWTDRTQHDQPNPGIVPQILTGEPKSGRYVRLTAIRLAPRQNDFILAVSELQVFDAAGNNLAAGKPATSLDSIEAAPRWRRSNLTDGLFPQAASASATADLAQLERKRAEILERRVAPAALERLSQATAALEATRRELRELPPAGLVYAGTIHTGTGNFSGTGGSGGKPRPIHVLARGDVRKPGPQVGPGVPPFLPEVPAEFSLPEDAPESARRLALAEWITRRDHPLTWRSMANRLWQYHFGRGLVDSPNDFGRMGQQPTHPALLDWLAAELVEGSHRRAQGQNAVDASAPSFSTQPSALSHSDSQPSTFYPQPSLKALHRLIVTSATYRQASADRPDYAARDSGNTLLWRANRRKLDAEAVRDSLLFVSGALDDRMGGPGFQDFVMERPEHSPHYEYHLHDPRDPRAHRRSVYRFLVRSQPQPFMTTLDCADPSMSVDKRNETINALQALALLNNGLTVVLAERLATELQGVSPRSEQIAFAFERSLGRMPSAEERQLLTNYAGEHGLANVCRLLFNLNEFAFVD